jgi:hypothetical protein
MREVVQERYQASRSFHITSLVQTLAQVQQFIVDPWLYGSIAIARSLTMSS